MANIINVIVDNVPFKVMESSTFQNNIRDKEVDTFGATTILITEAEARTFRVDKRIDLEINGVKTPYLITSAPATLKSSSKQLYKVEVTGIEYTRKLQHELVSTLTFTQPNLIVDDDPNTWRYTVDKVIEKLIFLSPNTYFISEETYDRFSIRSPDFEFKDLTLFDCLSEIGDLIDAVPRLIFNDVLGQDEIIFDSLNKKNNEIIDMKKLNHTIFEDGTTSHNSIRIRLENVLGTSGRNEFFPTPHTFTGFRTVDPFLKKDQGAFIPTGKPIKDLVNAFCIWEDILSKGADLIVEYQIEEGGFPVIFSFSLAEFQTAVGTDVILNAVETIFEKVAYENLPVEDGVVRKDIRTQSNSLFFDRGVSNIKGITFDDRGFFQENTDVLSNLYIAILFNNPDIIDALLIFIQNNEDSRAIIVEPFEITGSVPDELLGLLRWRIEFRTTENFIVNTSKQFFSTDRRIEKISNQTSRIADLEKTSFQQLSIVERLNILQEKFEVEHPNIADVHEIGDFFGDLIVTKASYQYFHTEVKALYEFDTLKNALNNFTDIDSDIRTTNIDTDNIIESDFSDKYEVILEEDVGNGIITEGDRLRQLWQNGYLFNLGSGDPSGTPNLVAFARRTGRDFDGNVKYTNTPPIDETDEEFQTEATGKGIAVAYMPLAVKIIGRSIVIKGKWENNLVITRGVDSDAGGNSNGQQQRTFPLYHSYIGTEARYQGEFELLDYQVGYGGAITVPFQSPFLKYLAPNSVTNNILATSLIIVEDYPIYKDRRQNVVLQIEIELKTNNKNAIIFPAFNKSHRTVSPQNITQYSAVILNEDITLENRELTSQFNGGSLTLTIDTFGFFEVENFGQPFAIYNTGNNEILYANNKPLTSGITKITYKMKNITNIPTPA